MLLRRWSSVSLSFFQPGPPARSCFVTFSRRSLFSRPDAPSQSGDLFCHFFFGSLLLHGVYDFFRFLRVWRVFRLRTLSGREPSLFDGSPSRLKNFFSPRHAFYTVLFSPGPRMAGVFFVFNFSYSFPPGASVALVELFQKGVESRQHRCPPFPRRTHRLCFVTMFSLQLAGLHHAFSRASPGLSPRPCKGLPRALRSAQRPNALVYI